MKKTVAQAPVSLSGLFVEDGEGDEEDQDETQADKFENETEVLPMNLAGVMVNVRQMAWHRANANQVWPGTFTLAEHIFKTKCEDGKGRYETGKVLELGSATGALALALDKAGGYELITCDIDDDGEVEENITWNYRHNGLAAPRHIAHTWGTEWKLDEPLGIKFIIASDILLYVSAYPALVQSLVTIFDTEPMLIEFLMSWNRRISESSIFFDLMKKAGFECHSYGHGLYSFYRCAHTDAFLTQLPKNQLFQKQDKTTRTAEIQPLS